MMGGMLFIRSHHRPNPFQQSLLEPLESSHFEPSHYCNWVIAGFKQLQALFAKPDILPKQHVIWRSIVAIDTCFNQHLITQCSELKGALKNNPCLSINVLCLSGALDIQRACKAEIDSAAFSEHAAMLLNLLLFDISMLRLLGLTNQGEQIKSRLPATLDIFLKVATNLCQPGLIEDESKLTQLGFIQLCCSMMVEHLDRHPHHPDVQYVLQPYFDWVSALCHPDGYHSIITPVVTRALTQIIDGMTEQRTPMALKPEQMDAFLGEPLSDGVVAGYYVTQMVITALNSPNHRVLVGALVSWVFSPTRIHRVLPYFLYALGQLNSAQQGVFTQLLQQGLTQSSVLSNLLIPRMGTKTIRDWLQKAPPLTKLLIKDGWFHMIPLYSYLGAQRWATNYGEEVVLAKGPKLGEGGYAVVREYPLEGGLRVIKKIDSDPTSSQNWERVFTELTGYQHCLQRHVLPDDMQIWGVYQGKHSLKCAIVMDKITPIQNLGAIDPIQIMRYATDWLKQLQSMHKVGLLHNDVKPDNLGVNRHQQGVLIDFGLVRPIEARIVGSIVKKQGIRLELGIAHDVFAFGISLLACLGADVVKVATYKSGHFIFNHSAIRSLKKCWLVIVDKARSQGSMSDVQLKYLTTVMGTCLDITEGTTKSDITNDLLNLFALIIRDE